MRRPSVRVPRWLGAWLLACVLGLLGMPVAAQQVQPVPALTARVMDQAGVLDPAARQAIEDKLAALEAEKGAQVVFLVVRSTQPEDIASYANRVGSTWKIGREGVGDGVLLVVAVDDRRVRIEVARTLEGAIPDLAASRIIEEVITPAFRQGDFAGGLQGAADRLGALIRGEPLPPPARSDRAARAGPGFNWFDLAIFMFFAVPIAGGVLRRIFGRPLGSMITGGGVGLLAFLLTSSLVVAVLAALVGLFFALVGGMGPPPGTGGLGRHRGWGGPYVGGWGGHGGRSGGWGGGGGFSSGGGGSFGGGGASGNW